MAGVKARSRPSETHGDVSTFRRQASYGGSDGVTYTPIHRNPSRHMSTGFCKSRINEILCNTDSVEYLEISMCDDSCGCGSHHGSQ